MGRPIRGPRRILVLQRATHYIAGSRDDACPARRKDAMTDGQLVLTMLPNADQAAEIAHTLVTERLAACVNLVPAVRSIYRWQEKINDDNEVLLLIKTRSEQFDRLRSRILELHPYEVPEVLAIPIEAGYAAYLEWLARETG
jgi:periplasmic divalent cation tolerance protein